MPYYISSMKWRGRKKKTGIITARGSPLGPPQDQKPPHGIRGASGTADSVQQPKKSRENLIRVRSRKRIV